VKLFKDVKDLNYSNNWKHMRSSNIRWFPVSGQHQYHRLIFSSRATLNKFFIFAKSTMMNWAPSWMLIYPSGKERVAGTRCD
jgi:hypothetical protein